MNLVHVGDCSGSLWNDNFTAKPQRKPKCQVQKSSQTKGM